MSVLCCGEADESNGAEHAMWCQSYDLAKAVAAARREGWAQAIEALREQAGAEQREAATYPSGSPGRTTCLQYVVGVERAIRALTDRAGS